jgi:hypothetical protein
MIKPFIVDVPSQVLDDLKLRLGQTRWPGELISSDWNYGTSLTYLKELTTYWQETFDWRSVEREINAYPNFIADIDGHHVHFIHSMRIYYDENSKKPLSFGEQEYVSVPVAFAKFPKEIPTPPRSYMEKGFNIRRWTNMPAGGHFAAMEQPELLAKDMTSFFSALP